jgi:hypothetical protein
MKGNTDEIISKPGPRGENNDQPISFDKAAIGITHEGQGLTGKRGAKWLEASRTASGIPLGGMVSAAVQKRLGLEIPTLK